MLKRIWIFIIVLPLLHPAPVDALTLAETIRETVQHNPDILVTRKDHLAIQQATSP